MRLYSTYGLRGDSAKQVALDVNKVPCSSANPINENLADFLIYH
jgi:hypothetical protein